MEAGSIIVTEIAPDSSSVDLLVAATLREQLLESFGPDCHSPPSFEWGFLARDGREGPIVAGICGESHTGGLVIERLAVSPTFRRTGLGSLLARLAIQHGRNCNLSVATVETFEFQAPTLYPKLGFTLNLSRSGFCGGAGGEYLYFSRALRTDDADVLPASMVPVDSGVIDHASSDGRVVAVSAATPDSVEWNDLAQFTISTMRDHAGSAMNPWTQFESLCFAATCSTTSGRDGAVASAGDKRIVGGLSAKRYWGATFIDAIGVAKAVRNKGVGSALLARVLQHARDNGDCIVCVNAFDFQVCWRL